MARRGGGGLWGGRGGGRGGGVGGRRRREGRDPGEGRGVKGRGGEERGGDAVGRRGPAGQGRGLWRQAGWVPSLARGSAPQGSEVTRPAAETGFQESRSGAPLSPSLFPCVCLPPARRLWRRPSPPAPRPRPPLSGDLAHGWSPSCKTQRGLSPIPPSRPAGAPPSVPAPYSPSQEEPLLSSDQKVT